MCVMKTESRFIAYQYYNLCMRKMWSIILYHYTLNTMVYKNILNKKPVISIEMKILKSINH